MYAFEIKNFSKRFKPWKIYTGNMPPTLTPTNDPLLRAIWDSIFICKFLFKIVIYHFSDKKIIVDILLVRKVI